MMARSSQPTIAVTGATGYVGRFVMSELLAQDVAVRALVRPGSDRDGFAAPIEWIEGDLRSPEALQALVDGATGVVHMAYEHVPGRYRGGEGEDLGAWLEANVTGSLRLLTLAAAAQVRRFVFLSSRAVFAHTEPGRVLDETHRVCPDSHYGAYKCAVEAFLRSFQAQHDMLTFSVRATGVYGVARPVERSKWWDAVLGALNGATDTPTAGGTEVFGGDVARVIWALLSRPRVGFDVIHLSDLYVTTGDVVRIARRCVDPHAALPASLPSSAANPLECRNLRELGIQLGGIDALETTVRSLVAAAQAPAMQDGR